MQRCLEDIQRRHLFRQLTPLIHSTAPWLTLGGHSLLNMSSNNYLGLADHPRLKEVAIAAIRAYGCGAGASRLITGTTPLHEQLEQPEIASLCEQYNALLIVDEAHATGCLGPAGRGLIAQVGLGEYCSPLFAEDLQRPVHKVHSSS
jgi:7-keto-8-aminopelargonate synthetase-like enzyme